MKKIFWLVIVFVCALMKSEAQENYPDPPALPASISKAEYFFDTDPGLGNGTAIALTPAQDISNFAATINLNGTGLTNGSHYFYLRTMDLNGRWSLTNIAFFENFNVPVYSSAGAVPVLNAAEYFIDTDPGTGNGIPVSLPSLTEAANVNILVNLTTLTSGVHRLYLRSRDENGKWSITNYAVFDNAALTPYPTAPSAAPAISQAEYYIDNDPGFGNGTAISISSSTDINNFSLSVPLTGLSQGRHTIFLRSRQNPWSLSAYAEFLFGSTLPVQWLYVKGEIKGPDAMISWATGEEQNTEKFIIEYSADGSNFTKAGEVPATGNVNGSNYNYKHLNVGTGAIYYRIKQIDKDGKFTYSKLILLVFQKDNNSMIVFPNPARELINISLPHYPTISKLTVYDINGRIVYRTIIPAGNTATTLKVNTWTKGLYIVKIVNEGTTFSSSFIKQ